MMQILAACAIFHPAAAFVEVNLDQNSDNLIHTTRILHPDQPGSYPVLTFLHGFALNVNAYDNILNETAEDNIVILFQMKFRAIKEGADEDAASLKPYLNDADKGILPRIGSSIMEGYSTTGSISLAGHSRGGGVISYGYSNGIFKDGEFASVALIDPVVMHPDVDVPQVAHLSVTKMRTVYYNDAASICVTHGWPDAIGEKFDVKDIKVSTSPDCKHLDVCSGGIASISPLCKSSNGDACQAEARALIADALSATITV